MSLLNAARDHVRQLLGVIQTRLELLGLELADARDHLIALFALTAIAVFFSPALLSSPCWRGLL